MCLLNELGIFHPPPDVLYDYTFHRHILQANSSSIKSDVSRKLQSRAFAARGMYLFQSTYSVHSPPRNYFPHALFVTSVILNFPLYLKVLFFNIILYLIYNTQPCFPAQCFCTGHYASVHLNPKCHILIVFQVNIIKLMATELQWAPYL